MSGINYLTDTNALIYLLDEMTEGRFFCHS